MKTKIDYSKYEGHTPEFWDNAVVGRATQNDPDSENGFNHVLELVNCKCVWPSNHDMRLLLDAPLLLQACKEKDARIAELEEALVRITDHGMPSEQDNVNTWIKCSMSVHRIAKSALDRSFKNDKRN